MSWYLAINLITAPFMAMIIFGVYVLEGNELEVSKVFTVIALIQSMRMAIRILPYIAMLGVEGWFILFFFLRNFATFFDVVQVLAKSKSKGSFLIKKEFCLGKKKRINSTNVNDTAHNAKYEVAFDENKNKIKNKKIKIKK